MEDVIRGKVFVLGDHVDTDQIIPAKYLSYDPTVPDERKYFGKYALSGVPPAASGLPNGHVPFVADGEFASEFVVVVAGSNFGCGSSREHAPLALSAAGVRAVVAEGYARIFYRNSINGAYLVPFQTPRRIFDEIATGDEVELDPAAGELRDVTTGKAYPLDDLGDVTEIVSAGGLFPYARRRGMFERGDEGR